MKIEIKEYISDPEYRTSRCLRCFGPKEKLPSSKYPYVCEKCFRGDE